MPSKASSDPGDSSELFGSDMSRIGYFVELVASPGPRPRSGRLRIYVLDPSGLGCARGCFAGLCCSGLRGRSHGKRTSALLRHLNDHCLSLACIPKTWTQRTSPKSSRSCTSVCLI